MQGREKEDRTMDIKEVHSRCDEQNKKKVNGPKEDERINWNKLKGMGMMNEWMKVRTQLGIGVKLITSFPSCVC